jgi:CRISPR-associated exonuclease Cas4
VQEEDYLFISALQHFAFCPRQFALIHIEQVWAENKFTAEGRLLHERVDSGEMEQRGSMRYERSVSLISHVHQITGKMDLLEIEAGNPPSYFPVEYKRGKPKIEDWDRIQLCAQALCIEEMRNVVVNAGAIWYWEVRHRDKVIIDDTLRELTINIIHAAREVLTSQKTPAAVNDKRCRSCSLIDLCHPHAFVCDQSKRYVNDIFSSA